ncbi:hypothetical protein SCUCBS95973_003626 [Sporothrix curviconia]|uniref:DUF7702 domain-containing protein n=1 Tax=Sporothrix curviconia TaxID=1260050 RepID=A0ABP0BGV2_9PEZI
MTLTIYNKISILQLAFFVPSLVVAVTLSYRHGFRRSAGWIYLVILSLMRIIGASLELATISSPDNYNLVVGAQTLQNIGLSPLVLVLLGLVTRSYLAVPESSRPAIPNARILRQLQLLVVVGLILSIVGGTDMGNQVGDGIADGTAISYNIPSTSKAGIAIMIVGYALLVLSSLVLVTCLGAIPHGEKRLLMAVFAALPFVFVRLLYSVLSAFDSSNPNFRLYGGSSNAGYYVLGMCTVMEIVAVIIFEVVGLTLPYVPHNERGSLLNPTRRTANLDINGQPLTEYPASNSQEYPKLQQGESA